MQKHNEEALQVILNAPYTLAALEELFRETYDKEKPGIIDQNNSLIGEQYRAYKQAEDIIEEAFKKLRLLEQRTDTTVSKERAR